MKVGTRRGALREGLLFSLAVLSACGFEPMYARRGGRDVAADLAAIGIGAIPRRIGQILRNDLIERLTPRGEPREPRYRLRVEVSGPTTVALAIQPDNTITRYNLRLRVSFSLTDTRTGRVLYRDRTRTVGSYNAVRSDFATLTARDDTARRAAREASEEIRTLLGVFFARAKSTTD